MTHGVYGKNYKIISAKGLTARYLLAPVLIAVMTTLSTFSLQKIISDQQHSSSTIRKASAEFFLLEKIKVSHVSFIASYGGPKHDVFRAALEESATALEQHHEDLVNPQKAADLGGEMNPAVKALYFDAPTNLNKRIADYLAAARKLIAESGDKIEDLPLLDKSFLNQTEFLLTSMKLVVDAHVDQSEYATQKMGQVEIALWFITMIILGLEALFIFRPMMQTITDQVRKLEKEKAKAEQSLHYLKDTQKALVESQRVDSLGRIVSDLCHKLSTPLGIAVRATNQIEQSIAEIKDQFLQLNEDHQDINENVTYIAETVLIASINLARAGRLLDTFKQSSIDTYSEEKHEFNLDTLTEGTVQQLSHELRAKRHRQGLERILTQVPKISALAKESQAQLFESLLDQLVFFCITSSMHADFKLDGLVAVMKNERPAISSAQGRFSHLTERSTETVTLLQQCVERLSSGASIADSSDLLIPMKAGDTLVAFVYLETGVSLTSSERSLIEVFVNHCSSLLENMHLYNELELSYQQAINTFAEMAEYKDDDTAMHLNRIAAYTRLVAAELGLSEKEAQHWGQAARLHDIGKMGIPDSILQKPDKLTEDEFSIMREHTLIGASILGRMNHMEVAKDIALSHHEHWNGKGYPKALKGDQIPLAARIVALVDVFDALVNKRCYKEAWTIQHALDYLQVNKGKQFDPDVVNAFDRLHARGYIAKLIKDSATLELGLD